jgi:hypothetical protein
MNRYRSYGEGDDQPATVGDAAFLGVDEYNAQENIRPGNVYRAVNHDFSSQDATTRGGFVCLPELGTTNAVTATGGPFGQYWIARNAASTNQWYGVAFGNGVFVAVSKTGTGNRVMTSPDGITWTSRTSAADYSWRSITYGLGKFVAVADVTNRAMYSTDNGVTWTLSGASSSGAFNAVTFGNGKFVAVGPSGAYMYSTDGITWTQNVTSPARDWGTVTFGNGYFIANCSNSGVSSRKAIRSTDGVTWSEYNAAYSAQLGSGYGNGVFLSVGFGSSIITGGIQYSLDNGLTWTGATVPVDRIWSSVAYGNGRFVVVSLETGFQNIVTSSDGVNWQVSGSLSASGTGYLRSATFGNSTFVTVASAGGYQVYTAAAQNVFASGLYSDPNAIGETWIMLVGYDKVGFFSNGKTSRTVSLGNYTVTEQSTIVQADNQVYLFRGINSKPLYWDGDWNTSFTEVPDTPLPPSAGFESIPFSNQATYYENRLWVVNGKDYVAASDILNFNYDAFTNYDVLANEISANTGNSDFIVATFPFGQNSLVVFKNKSVLLFQNVGGSLSDVSMTEVTRQVGLIGINAVTSIGPDLAYVSYGNINLLTLTNTNNSLQHKTLPLSTKIRAIMRRVNWEVGYKISLGYWNNKLYVSLPLDNSPVCNACVVYNFTTENWYGEWSFSTSINMNIQGWQVVDYLGLQRMHAITEDGRIFVTDEGQNDICGPVVAEISTELITRAYDTDNLNHFQRRIYLDLATNRPKFSAATYTEGANEESIVLTNQTYSRAETWKFNDSTYDLTNANDDFNRAYRKDYSSGALATGDTQGLPPEGLQCGTGFQPEMQQEFRLPLISRRQGRLSWIKVTNTQGFISVMSVGFETRPGQRANLIQV